MNLHCIIKLYKLAGFYSIIFNIIYFKKKLPEVASLFASALILHQYHFSQRNKLFEEQSAISVNPHLPTGDVRQFESPVFSRQ